MYLKGIEISGFKSFAKKGELEFTTSIAGIVGPNGSGKSNIAEAFRFVLGEQSFKSMRGKRGEDLIWGGSERVPRANRASVKAVFNNSSRLFDLDFDEVEIERTVHRDGVNQYAINGSQVRLKDVAELLAGAHIGSSGHHIISQGEADRILNTSTKERREMIEDALGLKVFQYKKKESERKLEHTKENITQVTSLRKEIAPHLRFLKRQVEKIEKSKLMREELRGLLREYLKREELYIKTKTKELASAKETPQKNLKELEGQLTRAREILEKASTEDALGKDILQAERELSDVRRKKDELSRKMGQVEGQVAFAQKHVQKSTEPAVPFGEVKEFGDAIEAELGIIEKAESLSSVKEVVGAIRARITDFFKNKQTNAVEEESNELGELEEQKRSLEKELADTEEKEQLYTKRYKDLQDEIGKTKDESRSAEREVFRITGEKNTIENVLRDLARDEEVLRRTEEEFKRELEEGAVLVGREVLQYEDERISLDGVMSEKRDVQEKRRRDIEKIKIRLEEFGGGSNEEVLKEYRDVSERDIFLEREILDLETSAETLKSLIQELDEKLSIKFREGISKINTEFQHFFSLLFGGGSASLSVLEVKKPRRQDTDLSLLSTDDGTEIEEAESETGIEISVSLPRKKIKGLQMLSGGERALTSIALLFAMSQVNPPPFLILDETDAALDEANSRKYGEMIKELSKKTQLILITHNRETMSTAGVLYGVTMGGEGVSKLLSVQFEEAVQVAK